MKQIIINSERQKNFCRTMINEMSLDGKDTVIFKKTDKSNTARQRRLRWLWMGEISTSGLGQSDTKDGVDLFCKWKFARFILLRDSDVFGAIFAGFELAIKDYDPETKKEYYRQFTRDYISVETLMNRKQEAEYLREVQSFWVRQGANLTDPSLRGVDLDRWENK